jgi:hypothetical protein
MRSRIIILLVACLLLTGVALASGIPSVDWNVIGGGGGSVVADSTGIQGTIGQAVVGVVADENDKYEICSGFWCGSEDVYDPPKVNIYLPLVVR